MKRVLFALALCAFGQFAAIESSCNDCLILTPHIKNGNASEARRLSEVNSEEYFGLKSHSGFVTVKKEYNNNLFFWYFPAPTHVAETPWIIWLQGGPGVSSMAGLFDIIGPIKIKNGTVKQRNVTWASDYSLVFLDNPVGAGYSFTDDERGYPDNEDDIGAQMLEFVLQFLEMFPELRSAPLFIAGQSYAGKYVPALGIQIHRYNQNASEPINMRGISIGNGLIELRNVMNYSELCRNLGLLDGDHIDQLKTMEEQVVQLIDNKQLVDAANKFNATIEFIKKQSGVNVYNFIKDPSSKAPAFESYITSPEVRQQIHVGNATFDYNNQDVYYKMLPDFANSTKPFVEELLEHYGVMSYSGQLDVILPYSLSKHMYATLKWSKHDEYVQAQRRRLRRHHNGSVVGYRKAGGNFVEVLVRGAGHSVPADQPDVAKYLIDSFIEDFK
ncbi:venom serine carboxypeptidase-like isoform X2 [Anticarsia gemmatalis]|uniref:venom serine carboxypeptidase-like isoform X2 n=1 Tax=Anticarsia gemmatalis TaxID=129554 RepID=UPI003F76E5F7